MFFSELAVEAFPHSIRAWEPGNFEEPFTVWQVRGYRSCLLGRKRDTGYTFDDFKVDIRYVLYVHMYVDYVDVSTDWLLCKYNVLFNVRTQAVLQICFEYP